jgi:hypothetical protein
VAAGVSGDPVTGSRGPWSAQSAAPVDDPDHTSALASPAWPSIPLAPGATAAHPAVVRPAGLGTVPAPVGVVAAVGPEARPAPAGADIDQVLDELAHRLEQAVEDLGLDGEG